MRRSNPISTTQIEQIKGKFSREQLPRITARVAREKLAEQLAVAPAPYRTFVDGIEGAALESVRPGGIILFRFARIGPVIDWIWNEILSLSPVLTGRYRDSHRFYVNGEERDAEAEGQLVDIPPGAEIVIADLQPYARKIEGGGPGKRGAARPPLSPQAPNGVYEITAKEARRRFPDADINFTYRGVLEGGLIGADVIKGGSKAGAKLHNVAALRYPAIEIRNPR
jgi:hypothetical protein